MRDECHGGKPFRIQRGEHGRRGHRGVYGVHEVSGSADASKLLWERQHGVHHQWTRTVCFDGMRAVPHADVDDGLFFNDGAKSPAGKSLLGSGRASHGFEPGRWSDAGRSGWRRVPHGTALGAGTAVVFLARRSHFRPVARYSCTFHGLWAARRPAGRLRAVGGATGNREVSRTESIAEAGPAELPSLVVNALEGGSWRQLDPAFREYDGHRKSFCRCRSCCGREMTSGWSFMI